LAHHALGGILAAIVTPVTEAGEPDTARFIEVARHLLGNGCDGLNVLGTTGEATSFSTAQRLGLMRAAAAGLPVSQAMVGTGAAAVADACALTREAGEQGFSGALVLPPFYYKGVPDDGILRYFDKIAEASAASAIPLYLYHFPAQSGLPYSDALIDRLAAALGGRLAGLKDSSGDMDYARRQAARADFDVFPSTEACLAEARTGTFAGCISATANVTAPWCARAFHDGDTAAGDLAVRMRQRIAQEPLVPAVKAMVAHRLGQHGIARLLPPFVELPAAVASALAADIDGLAA
jgi:4-hydroxy-tetrahydrodipicolinate synthase